MQRTYHVDGASVPLCFYAKWRLQQLSCSRTATSLWLCCNTILAPVASAPDAIQALPYASITQDLKVPQAVPFASIALNLERCTEVCCFADMVCGLAVGLVSRAMVAFQSVGWFGYDAYPTSARPWQNQVLYDWSARCPINIQDNWACGIMYAIIGYQVNLLMLHHSCLSYSMPCHPAC